MATPAIGRAAVQGGKELFEAMEPTFSRSSLSEMNKSDWGKIVKGMTDKYSQMWMSKTEARVASGMPRQQAEMISKATARLNIFGPKDSALVDAINNARVTHGANHAAKLGDDMSLFFKESQPRHFYKTAISQRTGRPYPKETTWRVEAGLKEQSPYSPQKLPERTWNQISRYMYLSLVAIPHLSQVLGTYPFLRDMDAFLKGINESVTDYATAKNQMLRSGAFTTDLAHALRPGSPAWMQVMDKFVMPGFTQLRKIESTVVAMSGKHAAINAAEDLVRSGGTNKVAEAQLNLLNIDPHQVLSRGGQLLPEELDLAMHKTVQDVMYMRTGLEVPPNWRMTAEARLFTQYKDYAFNQGRFLTDAYKRAWREEGLGGIAKISAYIATMFPLAGELIWSTENTFRKLDPTEREDRWKGAEQRGLPGGRMIDEYVNALGRAGGLGLYNTILRAGNRQSMARYLEFPLLSFVDDEYTGIHKGLRPNDPSWDSFYRTNLRRFGSVPGTILAHKLAPYQFEKPTKTRLGKARKQRITRSR